MDKQTFEIREAQKYNLVRSKIIEVNPEIMELKFGCKVILFSEEYSKPKKTYKVLDKREVKGCDTIVELCESNLNGTSLVFYKDKGCLKILGREITLADCLNAYETTKKRMGNDVKFTNDH